MKSKKATLIALISLSITGLGLWSCDRAENPAAIENFRKTLPPSNKLTVKQIMEAEGIHSIHYVEYYCTIINGDSDNAFRPAFEYYIDSSRMKMKQYYMDNPDWNISVYNLKKNEAWNYYYGVLTYQQLPRLREAFEQLVRAQLGSSLDGRILNCGTEVIDDKACDIFEDESSGVEWIWPEYRLPIQCRTEAHYDVHQITYTRKCQIEINIPFSDALFEPPK